MTIKSNVEFRNEIKDWIGRTYKGPFTKKDGLPDNEEVIDFSPLDFYTSGILYPQKEQGLDSDFFSSTDTTFVNLDEDVSSKKSKASKKTKSVNEESSDDELKHTTDFFPSSLGLSFVSKIQDQLKLNFSCGTYDQIKPNDYKDSNKKFKRNHVDLTIELSLLDFICDIKDSNWSCSKKNSRIELTHNRHSISLQIVKRKNSNFSKDENIFTVTVLNSKKTKDRSIKKVENCLFQPHIDIESLNGFSPFPDNSDFKFLSDEEIESKLLYRQYKNYALGHGCATDWEENNGIVKLIKSQVLPEQKLDGVDFDIQELEGQDDILFMKRLTDLDDGFSLEELRSDLIRFIESYKTWITKIESESEDLKTDYFENAKVRLLDKCKSLHARMLEGIKLLENEVVLRAFLDANKAIFMQRVMSDFSRHRVKLGRSVPKKNDKSNDDSLPNFKNIPFNASSGAIWENGKLSIDKPYNEGKPMAKWRPFQLAFMLAQINGIVNENSDDRETLDLLWFPTGGGKTEAYLGVIAFTIFHQRMSTKYTNYGVTVMMRYTLRMLNKQQFDRASILICACEIIRSENCDKYGSTRISNGLWVGNSFYPNKHKGSDAYPGNIDLLKKFISNTEKKKEATGFSPPVYNCPCCGNKLVKELDKSSETPFLVGEWGYHQKSNLFKRKDFPHNENSFNPFVMHCTNSRCHFFLDEQDFLMKTNIECKADHKCLPIYYVDEDLYHQRPTLLFATVDKYAQLAWTNKAFKLFNLNEQFDRLADPPKLIVQDELHLISSSLGTVYALFEFLIDKLCSEGSIRPKIIGATATVRNAKEQSLKVYNRKKYSQFPPNGLDIDDSFYSKKKKDDINGRVYVGVMASGFTSTTAKLRLDSFLHEGVNLIESDNQIKDNYYTLLAYFNTVKELGKYRTLLEDDIVAYRKLICQFLKAFHLPYSSDRITELSSQMSSESINISLDELANVKLQLIDSNNKIVSYLNRKGIITQHDLDLSKVKSWSWKHFITNDWDFLSSVIQLEESDREFGNLNTDDEKKVYEKTFKTLYNEFTKALCIKSLEKGKDPKKVAMATNMISVGVDIPRLNVMSISGQPKTTAEYIQASSRVGREVPGIVFTLYNQAKNRDRSHYENFKDYHQAYYKYVESTSVTPFSLPAMEKVADTIAIAYMKAFYFKDSQSANLDSDGLQVFKQMKEDFIIRFRSIHDALDKRDSKVLQSKVEEINEVFDNIEEKWLSRKSARFTRFMDLKVPVPNEQELEEYLFYGAESRYHPSTKGMLFALNSLRDVEESSTVTLKSFIND